MKAATIKIPLNFNQVLDLVKQLPVKEKIRLSKELEKDTLNSMLTNLLNTFKTDQLSDKIIIEEVEKVRADLYARKK